MPGGHAIRNHRKVILECLIVRAGSDLFRNITKLVWTTRNGTEGGPMSRMQPLWQESTVGATFHRRFSVRRPRV